MLFDSGLSGGRPESALAHNARMLGVPLGDLDAVVISHLHADHVGGLAAMRRRTGGDRQSRPKLVALSSHDSTPWTYGAFARRFGDCYRTLQAGEELRVPAAGA